MSNQGLYIIITCYNEGSAIIKLLDEIGKILKDNTEEISIVVVDDGSVDETPRLLNNFRFESDLLHLRILWLEFNVGHQAAIEQGILFAGSCNAKHAIIMDGDGEDDPAAIKELIKLRSFDIVHVQRGKREEGFGFQFAYSIYKSIFYYISKRQMDFGNYCMINDKVMKIIRSRSFIHLAAFLTKLKLSSTSLTFNRRPRLFGKSKMSISDLIHHAFRSFIEYAEEMVMIFLRFSLILFLLFVLTIGYILYLKFFTDEAILGWTSTLGIGLLTSALLCLGFFTTGVLLLNQSHLRSRQTTTILYTIVK